MKLFIRSSRIALAILLAAALIGGQFASTLAADENAAEWDTTVLKSALSVQPISMRIGEFEWGNRLRISEAIYFLAFTAYGNPKLSIGENTTVADRLCYHLRYLCLPGNEPTCRGGLGGWVDNPIAQALALSKRNPSVWDQLTLEEQQKLDFIMKVLTVVGNYTQNYENNPVSDMSQERAWSKMWGPNMEDGYVGIMIAAYYYFGGADKVNQILAEFDYDQYIAIMEQYGYDQMKEFFQKTGKALLEEGGLDTNQNGETGNVKGARIPFTYQDIQSKERVDYEPFALFCSRARAQFCHTVASDIYDGVGRIADGSISPYEGLQGMSYEFMARDSGGYRTDAHYIQLGLRNTIPIRATIQAFGDWEDSAEAREIESLMQVGVEDYLFKVDPKHGGFIGFSMGKEKTYTEDNFQGEGHMYFKEIWKKALKKDAGFTATLEQEDAGSTCVKIQGYHLNPVEQLHLTAQVMLYQNGKLAGLETQKFTLPPLTEMGEVGQIEIVGSADQVDTISVILFEEEQENLSQLGNSIHL